MKSRSFNILIVLSLLLSLLGGALTVTPARAASIVVNTNADTFDVGSGKDCTTVVIADLPGSGDGLISLREAICAANNTAGADTITFAANYTITLVFSQLPAITTQMTITGNGAANTIIQAGTCNPVTLKDNANANCTPTQNYRMFEVGTTGNLTLNGVTVRHGVCTSNANGCNTWGVVGGGIYNRGTLTMTGSVISGNLAHYGGGMFNLNSSSTLTNVTISGNSGIFNTGGVYNQNSSSTLTNVTISGNSAQVGAGMQNDTSNPTLTNVTFSNNSATNNAGGGMYNFNNSSPTLTNVTFSGNSAYTSGGGMINFGGSPTLTNVTFSGNSANTSGGGMYNASSSTPLLTNVIIANSTSGGNCYNDATSLNPASSHNLIDSASSCGLTDGNLGNKIGASYNALLGPLANNGGSTLTHALLAGSDAIDAGANCPSTDQRGETRPQGSACDIGSFESPPMPTSATFGDVPMSHPYWLDIEILYANGFTAGCSASPLLFCPEATMNRGESAVFMLRGNFGSSYVPPNPPYSPLFADSWASGPWAQKWAQGMLAEGLTAGCSTSPLLYCPWEQMPRLQAAVFGMRLKEGNAYTPPAATGTVFADITDPSLWYAKWAEAAYNSGILPSCGTQGGKPLFCPNQLVSRGLGAYMIVRAKNLSMP